MGMRIVMGVRIAVHMGMLCGYICRHMRAESYMSRRAPCARRRGGRVAWDGGSGAIAIHLRGAAKQLGAGNSAEIDANDPQQL